MSRLVLLVLPWVLGTVAPSPARWAADGEDALVSVDDSSLKPIHGFGVEDSLSNMFREVEELMEDSQTKLQNAAKEIESEDLSARFPSVKMEDLPPNYHNKSVIDTKIGNETIHAERQIVKETDNKTGSTFYEASVVSSMSGQKKQECIVDDDCGNRSYCQFANFEYKCLQCRDKSTCVRDGECCDGQLCVWGQCAKSTKGESGTICETQGDCNGGLCCTIQTRFLYPVCSPLSVKGEMCYNPHHRFNLFPWNSRHNRLFDLCPCASGLVCQRQSYSMVSICEEAQDHEKNANPESFPFVNLMPLQEINYEESFGLDPALSTENPQADTLPDGIAEDGI